VAKGADPNAGGQFNIPITPAAIFRTIGEGIYTSIRSSDPNAKQRDLLRRAGWTISNTGPRGSPIYRDPTGRRVTGDEAARVGKRLARAAPISSDPFWDRPPSAADRLRTAARTQLPRVAGQLRRLPRIGAGGALLAYVVGTDVYRRVVGEPETEPARREPLPPSEGDLIVEYGRAGELLDREPTLADVDLEEEALDRKQRAAPPRQPRPVVVPGPGPVSPVLTPVQIYTDRLPPPSSIPAPTAGPGTPPAPTPTLGSVLSRYGALGLPLLLSAFTTPQRQPGRARARDPLTPAIPGLTDDQGTLRDLLTPALTEGLYPFPGAGFIGGTGSGSSPGLCECPKPRKKSRKKSRSVCYSGRYIEGRRGLRKTKQRKVQCR
jgi:hypothetical protein